MASTDIHLALPSFLYTHHRGSENVCAQKIHMRCTDVMRHMKVILQEIKLSVQKQAGKSRWRLSHKAKLPCQPSMLRQQIPFSAVSQGRRLAYSNACVCLWIHLQKGRPMIEQVSMMCTKWKATKDYHNVNKFNACLPTILRLVSDLLGALTGPKKAKL